MGAWWTCNPFSTTSATSRQQRPSYPPTYTPEDFLADMERVTKGHCDKELTAVLVNESADTMRWLHEKRLRFRLMYDRQSFEVDGKRRFWGGLVLGTVGGGKGLIEQHLAAAEKGGTRSSAGRRWLGCCGMKRGPWWGWSAGVETTRSRSRPAPWCWPAAGSSRTRRCVSSIWDPTGELPRCAARPITPATCSGWRWTQERNLTGSGAFATPLRGTPPPRPAAISNSPTSSPNSPIRWESSSTVRATALSTRGQISATTPTPSTVRRSSTNLARSPTSSSIPRPCRYCARTSTQPPAYRGLRPTLWAPSRSGWG